MTPSGSLPLTLESIRQAPKALLHDHLDGGLRPATVLELAEANGYGDLPATDVEGLATFFRTETPTLVLGSSQRADSVDAAAASQAGIDVVRRRSGGGGVPVVRNEDGHFEGSSTMYGTVAG